MKKLTKEQVNKLDWFCGSTEQSEILHNGEIGYCETTKTLVACCHNCGDYFHVDIKELLGL